MIKHLPFDFQVTISGKMCLWEYHGEQHYKPISFGSTKKSGAEQLARNKKSDRIKRETCRALGIPYFAIKYTQFDNMEEVVEFWVSNFFMKMTSLVRW